MIIAVDFDGTLQINGQPNGALIADLRAKQAHGKLCELQCATGRGNAQSRPEQDIRRCVY